MATKITELAALAAATDDDIFPVVDSPGSSPVTKKMTKTALLADVRYDTYGVRAVGEEIDLETGTLMTFCIPSSLNGCTVVGVEAYLPTPSSSGSASFKVYNVTDSVYVNSTALSLAASVQYGAVSGLSHSLASGDIMRVECTAAGTGTKGLDIMLKVDRL